MATKVAQSVLLRFPRILAEINKEATYVQNAQTGGAKVLKQGYAEKKGNLRNRAYKSRWLVLTECGDVLYFLTHEATVPLGSFSLVDAILVHHGSAVNKLIVRTKTRDWGLKYDSKATRLEWEAIFKEVIVLIQMLIKPSPANALKLLIPSMSVRRLVLEDEGFRKPTSLSVGCVTWNLAERLPEFRDLSFVEKHRANQIVAVAVQELQSIAETMTPQTDKHQRPSSDIWNAMLLSALGSRFELVAHRIMGGIALAVFARSDVSSYVSMASSLIVPCGIGNVLYNKGAVVITLDVCNKKIAFIGAHFPAHHEKVVDRNAAYVRICEFLMGKKLEDLGDQDSAAATSFDSNPLAPNHPSRVSISTAVPFIRRHSHTGSAMSQLPVTPATASSVPVAMSAEVPSPQRTSERIGAAFRNVMSWRKEKQPPKPVNFGLVNFSRDDDSGDEVAEYSSPAASTAAAAPSGEDEGGGRIRTQEDTDELQGDTTELDEDELRNLANLPRNAVVEDLEELDGDTRYFDRCFFMGDLNYRLEAKKALVEDLVTVADLMRRETVLVHRRSPENPETEERTLESISSNTLSRDELKRGLFVLNLLRGMGVCGEAPAPKDPTPHAAQSGAPDTPSVAKGQTSAPADSGEVTSSIINQTPSGPSEEEVRYLEAAIARVREKWTAGNSHTEPAPDWPLQYFRDETGLSTPFKVFEYLLQSDQLVTEMSRKNVLQGFMEGPIRFPPTYKFDSYTNVYDTSKKARAPAWCDRVLFSSDVTFSSRADSPAPSHSDAPSWGDAAGGDGGTGCGAIELLRYDYVPGVFYSDHRAVVAEFRVDVSSAEGDGEEANS